ncbi:MAG: DUF86 domain-containing protein, partial [Bradymonadaceae bacterium]
EKARSESIEDWMADDLYVLHLQRGIQAAIDSANHLVAANGWSTPDTAAESFDVLADHDVYPADFADTLTSMVGFRNIAVHAYGTLDMDVVHDIVHHRLDDLETFADYVLQVTVRADE